MAIARKWMPSPNFSSRGGSGVRLIVIHTTEGAQTIESLGSFFGQSSSGVSSHVGTDNKHPPNQILIGEYVKRGNKAWTAGNANPVAVQCEMCTPSGAASGWTRDYWLQNQMWMIEATAAWVREEAAAYGIPVRALSSSEAQGSGRGVCQHSNLGTWGGGHHDAGPGFPMDVLIQKAGGSAPPQKPPASGGSAPKFPYPSGHYIGLPSSDPACHSGCYGGTDATNCRTWQSQMAARGWTISADGCYGSQSQGVCTQFQREKGLAADGLVGSQTWAASWNAPVT